MAYVTSRRGSIVVPVKTSSQAHSSQAFMAMHWGEEFLSGQLDGFLLAGDISAEAWVKTLLQDELPAQAYGRLLLAPGAKAPIAIEARGRQVCSCFDVRERQIEALLKSAVGSELEQLANLQNQLRCGTNCGSCLPELKRMVQAQAQHAH